MSIGAGTAGVYFIQAEATPDGLIKIGYASDVTARLRDLQCGSPVRLMLLGVIANAPAEVEKRLHRRFADVREHGEWFRPVELLRRLANGEESFLASLVTLRAAAKVLKVSAKDAEEALKEDGDCYVEREGVRLRTGDLSWRFYLEDLKYIAAKVEQAQVRRAAVRAAALMAQDIRAALREETTGDAVRDAVDRAMAELFADSNDSARDLPQIPVSTGETGDLEATTGIEPPVERSDREAPLC